MRVWTIGARARGRTPKHGPWVPAALLHVTYVAVAAGLCLFVFASPWWRAIGFALVAGSALAPTRVPAWWLVLALGLGSLGRAPSAPTFEVHGLLAGLPLLQVLGSLSRQLPWDARLQPGALARPLRRGLFVQLALQPVAALVLRDFSAAAGTVRGAALVAAAALGVMAIVLAWRARRVRAW